MNWLDFNMQSCKDTIKLYKKSLAGYRGIFYLNFSCAAYQGSMLYFGLFNNFTAGFFGSLVANLIWLHTCISSTKDDIKLERQHLSSLQDMKDKEIAEGARRQFENYDSNPITGNY